MDIKKIVPVCVVGVLIIGGGSFYSGMKYGESKQKFPNFGNRENFAQGMMSGQGGLMRGNQTGGKTTTPRVGGGFISGEILSIDQGSLTIKSSDGGSKLILLSDSTQVMKMDLATKEEIMVGENVMVIGTNNNDGSTTASTIQIRPSTTGSNSEE